VGGDQIHHRRREHFADEVRDPGAVAVARDDQSARLELFERIAQDRPRHIEPARQVAFARQTVARAQDPLEDQVLDTMHDLVGGAGMLDSGVDLVHMYRPVAGNRPSLRKAGCSGQFFYPLCGIVRLRRRRHAAWTGGIVRLR
jgi:hypothetical protein